MSPSQRSHALALLRVSCDACRGVVTQSGLLEETSGSASHAAEPKEVINLKHADEALKEQIKAAARTIQELRAANSQLHAFIVEDQ